MKKTDLEKLKGKTIAGRQAPGTPERFGKASGEQVDRKEQRERDRLAGLVPYAVKLPNELITELRALAEKKQVGLNELTAELLKKGLKAK